MTKYYTMINEEYPAAGVVQKMIKMKSILTKKYQWKQGYLTAVKYRERLAKVNMKENEDPKVLIEKLDKIRNMHPNFVIEEVDLVAVAVQKVPDVLYNKAVLAQEQHIRHRVENKPLMLSDVYQVMTEMYCMNTRNVMITDSGKTEKEVALSGADGGRAKCYKCDKQGHKAAQQYTAKSNQDSDNKSKFTGKTGQ